MTDTAFDSTFAASGGAPVTNGSGVDDAFDLICTRSTENSPAKTNKELEAFDPLGGNKVYPVILPPFVPG